MRFLILINFLGINFVNFSQQKSLQIQKAFDMTKDLTFETADNLLDDEDLLYNDENEKNWQKQNPFEMTKDPTFETADDLVDEEDLLYNDKKEKNTRKQNAFEMTEDLTFKTDDALVDDEDLLYDDADENNVERIYTEFKLVSLLVNRIILDSIKDHKRTNHKHISQMRKHKKRQRYHKKGPEKITNDGEMIPYPRVG
jgi:hypothetical protein